MVKKYILSSIKLNKNKSKILLITSSISLILLLVFSLIFFSVSEGIKNRNNQKFGEYDLQLGYIQKNLFFDNEKVGNMPIPYEKINRLLVLELDDASVIYGLEKNSMELEKYQVLIGNKELDKNKVIVNKNYADKYNLKIGDSITLHNHNYEISAIVASNIQDSLSLKIFMSLFDMQSNFNLQEKTNLIQLKVKNNKDSVVGILNEYSNDKKIKYDSMKNKDIGYKKLRIYTPLFYIMTVGMLITYIISLYGIFKIRIKSRLFEITILKRLGISNKYLYRIFIGENSFLALIGSILGIFLSGIIYGISNSVSQKLDISFQKLSFSAFLLLALVYLVLNLLIVSLMTFMLLRKEKNKYADEIVVIYEKEKIINSKTKIKCILLLTINVLSFILAIILNIESIKYGVILINIVSFLVGLKYCFMGLYKLSENESLFSISYAIKSFVNNYKKYSIVMKLMVLSIVVLLQGFNYLTVYSNKVKENTLKQLPADYIITNSSQNKSENFLSKNDYNYIKDRVNGNDLININYTKDYKIVSNINYSDDWIRLSEKSKVDKNEIEIIKLDIEKRDKLRNINVIEGKLLNEKFSSNELILNKKLMKLLNLKVGDYLELKSDKTGKIENYKISTIVDTQIYPFNLVAIAPSASSIEASNIISVEVYNITNDSYNKIKNYINSSRHLEGIYTRDVINETLQFYNFIYYALLFLNIFILIIFIINLFNSVILSIEERKSEIQILKNIGVPLEKTREYILGEIYINFSGIIIFSALISIVSSIMLALKIEVGSILLIYGLLFSSFIVLVVLARYIIKRIIDLIVHLV